MKYLKVKVVAVMHDECEYYLELAKKLGYHVYVERDPDTGRYFYYTNVLKDEGFWRSPNMTQTSYGNKVVMFDFKGDAI